MALDWLFKRLKVLGGSAGLYRVHDQTMELLRPPSEIWTMFVSLRSRWTSIKRTDPQAPGPASPSQVPVSVGSRIDPNQNH